MEADDDLYILPYWIIEPGFPSRFKPSLSRAFAVSVDPFRSRSGVPEIGPRPSFVRRASRRRRALVERVNGMDIGPFSYQ
jgi:hypothetical protein